ncbi:MAG: DUF3352 domain-containing protein [Candidatus Aminicenantes bacterium]|nr:DUF3352 domain-containing protein [Candidatus Aminicenantes bacterium]
MKKLSVAFTVLALFIAFLISCAPQPSAPKAGTARVDDMLTLIPKDVQGVFFVDVHKAASTEFMDNQLKEEDTYEKYQEFIQETGIDPKKDIYFLAAGLTKGLEEKEQKGVVALNLKYDKEALLSKVKEEEGQPTEEDYNGITLYSWEDDEDRVGAFLDDSNIILGNQASVKAAIDTYQGKAENVLKNQELVSLIEKTNKEAIFWGAMHIPPEAVQKASSENPMFSAFEAVTGASLYFDYKNKSIIAEIKVMSEDEAKNKQIVDALNGFKAMGAMAAAKEPEVGELLDTLEISSGPDHAKIYASIPEDLINKLKSKTKKSKD